LASGSIKELLAFTTTTGKVMSGKSASLSEKKQRSPTNESAVQTASVAVGASMASFDKLNRAMSAFSRSRPS
jgi:hypothetical protein